MVKAKGNCTEAYRKGGRNSVHCKLQANTDGKWDFCAHQYFCTHSNQWELTEQANDCPLRAAKTVKQPVIGKKKAEKKKKAAEKPADKDNQGGTEQ